MYLILKDISRKHQNRKPHSNIFPNSQGMVIKIYFTKFLFNANVVSEIDYLRFLCHCDPYTTLIVTVTWRTNLNCTKMLFYQVWMNVQFWMKRPNTRIDHIAHQCLNIHMLCYPISLSRHPIRWSLISACLIYL